MIKPLLISLSFIAVSSHLSAACLYGSAQNADGSKIDGTARVTTSWNSKTAYPRKGSYELCLGSNPKQRITVYLDGSSYRRLYVDGDTRLDLIRK